MSIDHGPSSDVAINLDFQRRAQAHTIAMQVLDRRNKGELVADEQVIADHPHLVPEINRELILLRTIQAIGISLGDPSGLVTPSEILASDELERPVASEDMSLPVQEPESTDLPDIAGYRLLRQIGRGGQGTVYEAIQESTQRKIAIKVITGTMLLDARHRTRFEREVRILATLAHPHLISILAIGQVPDGSVYLAMEYVDGCSLEEFARQCARDDPSHPQLLWMVLTKVARAIHAAHLSGVLHRDLKPSNIRVDRHREPRILDFGLGQKIDQSDTIVTGTGEWVGSLNWMSPEQVSGESAAGVQTDIYALGVVIYQCLTGQFPYSTAGSMLDVMNRIRKQAPIMPSRVLKSRAGRSRSIDAVLLKALAKDPVSRYQTAEDLAIDLELLALGQKPKARGSNRRLLIAISLITFSVSAILLWRSYGSEMFDTDGLQLPHRTNRFGMSFVEVPAGKFIMGDGTEPDEMPHEVRITHKFWIETTEVTRQQYAEVMQLPPPMSQVANLPIANVSWDEANAFCEKLSALEKKVYQLPTEAQWEYACRAGEQIQPDAGKMTSLSWNESNSSGVFHPVATKLANSWGLFDMFGNAKEWCRDNYASFSPGLKIDPTGPRVFPKDAIHVARGGDIDSSLGNCRASRRFPGDTDISTTGLRAVLTEK